MQLANFTYNVSQLLTDTFTAKEKLSKDVIMRYLSYSTKEINQFNHVIDLEYLQYKEIALKFGSPRIDKALIYAYMNKRQRLKNKLHTMYDKKMTMDISTRLQMDQKEKKEQKLRLYAQMMETQKLSIPDITHHVDTPFFEELFNGIRNFFVRMFGS